MANTFGTRQLVNHFQNHALVSTKHQLFENLTAYCENKRLDVFRYMPVTFTMQTDSLYCPHEFEKFVTLFNALQKMPSLEEVNAKVASSISIPQSFKLITEKLRPFSTQAAKFCLPETFWRGENVWVLKATGFNRGIGIHVFNSLSELHRLLKEYAD